MYYRSHQYMSHLVLNISPSTILFFFYLIRLYTQKIVSF